MELSRSEYPSMLSSLQPSPAVTVLRDRLKKVQAFNYEIADWLQERRKIEEIYVQSLNKLAKKVQLESSELGNFQQPWARIITSTSSLASSHQQFCQKIESEVERPLREFSSGNKEWVGLKTFEGNLAGIAKQIDTAEEKAEKLRKKGNRAPATRVAEAAGAVEKAVGDWDSQAPYIFEKLQAVDEARLNNLRDCLTRYHTLEVDHAQRAMHLAEESLGILLDINTNDEIKAFADGVTNGRPKIERQGSRAPSTAAAGMPSSTPSIVTDDSVSVQSAGSGGAASGGGSGGGLGHGLGLRRLGTVLRGRNRNSTVPYLRSGSPERRSSDKLSIGRRDGQPPITPASPRTSEFASSGSRTNLAVPSPSSPSINETGRPTTPKTNGNTQNGVTPPTTIADSPKPPASNPTVTVTTDEPQKDADGYTIPPPVTDIGGVALDENEEQAAPQFKVEIRNDVIPEEEEEADAALTKVASHLRAQNTVSRKNRGRRDARDVRNTMFFPNPTGPGDPLEMLGSQLNSSSPPLTPLKVPRIPAVPPSEASDTQSIRSSRSVTSLTGAVIKHPELTEKGLTSSLVEAVSVSFDAGVATKCLVIGEIALAYNPQEDTEVVNGNTEILRMDNFTVLEKVAPNPSFITPVPEKVGEYTVVLSSIVKTSVAFKYQVHLDEPTLAVFAPIIVHPVWRIEPHQASLILNYKPNPNFKRLNGASTLFTLKNVIFITGVEGPLASSCQSKPVGTFSREQGRLAWKLGDITLGGTEETAAAGTGKLLARFATADGPARSTPIEMKWEISGDDSATVGSGLTMSMFVAASPTVPAEEPEADPFADELEGGAADAAVTAPTVATSTAAAPGGTWKPLANVRRIASGKYVAV